MITRETLAGRLKSYLAQDISLATLVAWAENVMMDEEIDPNHLELIRDIVARLGVADVTAFGLSWEELNEMLNKLGYRTRLEFETI